MLLTVNVFINGIRLLQLMLNSSINSKLLLFTVNDSIKGKYFY